MFSVFKKFKNGLKRTADAALGAFSSMLGRKISEEDIAAIEETLFAADFGYETAEEIVGAIKKEYGRNREMRGMDAARIGADYLYKILAGAEGELVRAPSGGPTVVCLVGVNGAGKTTTCAKLAFEAQSRGEDAVLGACDTFRAAANEQIREWASRLGVRLVESEHGADAAATAFDAWQCAKAKGAKWLFLDTAGRLHTKENLMSELSKIGRVLKKNDPSAPHNSVIVLDGSLGSNNIEQALAFDKAFPLTGAIITKLDGTGRGGSIAGIYRKLKVPILYVGLGEKPEDLQKFNARAYADGVFGLE